MFEENDFFNEMSDDDDEEIIEYLNTDFFNRVVLDRVDHFNTKRDSDFLRRFRLTKNSVLMLLHRIRSKLECSNRCETVSPMDQLLCTLRFYATGSQLITCGDFIGIHESTACRVVHKVTDAIAKLYPEYVKMPTTEVEKKKAAASFYKIARFPRVIGAIDCTFVRIKSPGGEHAEIYRNRKGYFALNVQAICSSDLLFNNIVARWHGSAHDSHIWDNCNQRRLFLQGHYGNFVLVGDSGYAQTKFMMTPLATVTSQSQSLYNESQIRSRNVVERLFGIWKRRFPILSRGIQVHLSKVPGIIIATSVLHNLATANSDPEPPEEPDYPILPDVPDNFNGASRQNLVANTVGNRARLEIIELHFDRLINQQ